MGFNTAAIIRNDCLGELERDGSAGRRIADAVKTAGHRDTLDGYAANYLSVLPSQHADTAQVVVIAANSIHSLGHGHWRDTDEMLLRALADQHGFRLVRKSRPSDPAMRRGGGR